MGVQSLAARLRTILLGDEEFAIVLRGAGLALAIRVIAGAIGFSSLILLARWMGYAEYGYYSFAVAWMMLLAYPATLGLPGAAVRFVAQYTAADDWQHVVGFLGKSSWLAVGNSVVVALLAILVVLYLRVYLDPGYIVPTIAALAGMPIVALSIVRSEAIRGLGLLVLAWSPFRLGQPLLLLLFAAVAILIAQKLSATMVIGASVLAYAIMILSQYGALHVRFATRLTVEPKTKTRLWLGTALPFVWIYVATNVIGQSPVIMIGFLLNSKEVAVYSAAAATAGVIGSLMEATNALSAPRFAALHARKRHGELQSLFANVVRLTFWPSLMVAVILITFGPIILRLFGPEFDKGYDLLIILTIGQLVSAAAGPAGVLLRMTGYQVLTAQVLGISAVLSVVLGLVLTQIWGNFGTAIAFSGATILWNAILMVLAIYKFDIYPLLRRLFWDL
jgi:O-antigen/teichoic acid export membrane protein